MNEDFECSSRKALIEAREECHIPHNPIPVGIFLILMAALLSCDTGGDHHQEPPNENQCGDGIVSSDPGWFEECDDGNEVRHDGCTECMRDHTGPGSIKWILDDFGGYGMTIGKGGLLYVNVRGKDETGKGVEGVACYDPVARKELWRDYASDEEFRGFPTIGLASGLVYYRHDQGLYMFDMQRENFAYSNPSEFAPEGQFAIASSPSSLLFYSLQGSLVQISLATGTASTPAVPLEGYGANIKLTGTGMGWVSGMSSSDYYLYHLDYQSSVMTNLIDRTFSNPPYGILGLAASDEFYYLGSKGGNPNDTQLCHWSLNNPTESYCMGKLDDDILGPFYLGHHQIKWVARLDPRLPA